MLDEWYSPRDIHFTREQMLWLIAWLPVLGEGNWPPEPRETGYTEAPKVQKSRSRKAHFQTPAEYYAEVTYRLKSCGTAGETLVWEVQHGLDVYELLSPPAKQSLNYISGWRRRRRSFPKWCWEQSQKRTIYPFNHNI